MHVCRQQETRSCIPGPDHGNVLRGLVPPSHQTYDSLFVYVCVTELVFFIIVFFIILLIKLFNYYRNIFSLALK